MKRLIGKIINKMGYRIQKISKHQDNYNPFTMEDALKRCVERGLNANTVIDVGASDGRWTEMCKRILPIANYFLIEALPAHKENLEEFKKKNKNIDFIIAAAGSKEGKLYFKNDSLFGGVASEIVFDDNFIEQSSVTIDGVVYKNCLPSPYLIKLDTHGFELPILEGAKETLKKAELIIIECYNYQLTKESLKYYQMCEYMERLGFSSIELIDFGLRNYDRSFWQMDIFFIPSNRDEFSYNSYK